MDYAGQTALNHRWLRSPASGKDRSVSLFDRALVDENDPSERMRRAIDSPYGRRLYSRGIATVEPVFANRPTPPRPAALTLGRLRVQRRRVIDPDSSS